MVFFRRGGVISSEGGSADPPVPAVLGISDSELTWAVEEGQIEAVTDPLVIFSENGRSLGGPVISWDYGAESPWLIENYVNQADGSVIVYFTVDATLLTAGNQYVAAGTINDSKASNTGLPVSMTLDVTAAIVTFSVSPSSFSVPLTDEQVGIDLVFTVTSTGNGIPNTPTVGTITGAGAGYLGTPVVIGTGPWTVTIPTTAIGGTPGGPYVVAIPFEVSNAQTTPQTINGSVVVSAAAAAFLTFDRSLDDASADLGGADPAPNAVGMRSTVALQNPQIVSLTYSGSISDFCTPSIGGLGNTTLFTQCSPQGQTTTGFGYARIGVYDPACQGIAYYEAAFNIRGSVVLPSLIVSPTGISKPVIGGQNIAPVDLIISNGSSGGLAALGVITAALDSVVSWVTVSYNNGVATFTFNTAALADGTYSVGFSISASLAGNSPFQGTVQIQVATASGSYVAPEWTLPSFVTFDSGDDSLDEANFVKPAYGDFS